MEVLRRRLCGACRDAWVATLVAGSPAPEVLTPPRRSRLFALAAVVLFGTLLGPALVAAGGLRALFPTSWWPAALGAAAGLTVGFQWQAGALARFSARANAHLAECLVRRLAREGLAEAVASAPLVGLSIGEEHRAYWGDNAWDVGFLLCGPGWLAYYGDQARFSLRAEQVREAVVDPPTDGGKLVDTRVLLRWRDDDSGAQGTMALHPTTGDTRAAARASLVHLAATLEAWRAAPAPQGQWVAPLPPRVAPQGVGDPKPSAFTEVGAFPRQLALGAALAVLAALLSATLRLAFDLRLPYWAVIPIVVVVTAVLHEALEQRRRDRR